MKIFISNKIEICSYQLPIILYKMVGLFYADLKRRAAMNIIHVTHEAVEKIGGIGTVIDGLCTSESYIKNVDRTVLVGPLFRTDQPAGLRLGADSKLTYSTLDYIDNENLRDKFSKIEEQYGVSIILGKKKLIEPYSKKELEVEVLLFEVSKCNVDEVNKFKGELFENFQVASDKFQDIWDYEQYIRIAKPAVAVLQAIGAIPDNKTSVILSHEYMGMPTALAGKLTGNPNIRTIFHAHEVASVRSIVENNPGHDTMFYNVMKQAKISKQNLPELFPDVENNHKHGLVCAAKFCDQVFAVGDYVKSELEFLAPEFTDEKVSLVYNGIQSKPTTLSEKLKSRTEVKNYLRDILGFMPDYIFTHVARPVRSKALWRDLKIMHYLEPILKQQNKRAVYLMLGTLGGQRSQYDIEKMASEYGWPVVHKHGYPDLAGGEESVFTDFENYNYTHRATRAVLVNQWGWSQESIGKKILDDTDISDLRKAADLEFGMSIYEPFGISQFEALGYGGLCLVTDICGCAGYIRNENSDTEIPAANYIEASFLNLNQKLDINQLMQLSISQRNEIENIEAEKLSKIIAENLPKSESDIEKNLKLGFELASKMSWDNVVDNYFMPGLKKIL